MIYNIPNLKDTKLMGRLIDIQEIENEKIEDYFEYFSYNLESREYNNNFKLGIEFINTNNHNNKYYKQKKNSIIFIL